MASTPTCDGRRSSLYRPKIEELVRDLNARLGLTMVFVSHDLSQVERVADRTARYLIPLGGMAIGNSMNAASLTLTRIRDDVREQRPKVEAALALGATGRQAASPILKTALQSALIPLIDATKTTGIIFLPGAMVGMIIAGANPLEAVRLQIVVLYMLLGSVSIAAILVGTLSYRSFFTPRHQIRKAMSDE